MSTFIVAELGINHDGNIDICKKMIKLAKDCGADAVKLQLLNPELISIVPWLIEAQKRANLKYREYIEVKHFSEKINIDIFSSIGDVESFKMFKRIGFSKVKISSSNLNNWPLHEMVAKLKLPVIVSTGGASLSEINRVVSFYQSKKIDLMLTHCIPQYPTEPEETFLKAIPFLKDIFNVPVGFSDHTKSTLASVVAVALGADIIEKHFTLNNEMEGPDHNFSLNPQELKLLVSQIRYTEKTLGDKYKYFSQKKEKQENIIRRAIIFTNDKKLGYTIKREDIFVARPKFHCDKEIDPFDYKAIVGKSLLKDIDAFEPLTYDHI